MSYGIPVMNGIVVQLERIQTDVTFSFISHTTGLSKEEVRQAVSELEAKGLVRILYRNKNSVGMVFGDEQGNDLFNAYGEHGKLLGIVTKDEANDRLVEVPSVQMPLTEALW